MQTQIQTESAQSSNGETDTDKQTHILTITQTLTVYFEEV